METKRVLFCAESVYQLFNAITLRMTERAEYPCDLIINSATSWDEEMLIRLQNSGVFTNVFRPQTKETDDRFWEMDLEKKIETVQNPQSFFGNVPVSPVYDELFVSIDHIYWKMLYHYEVVAGKTPEVFMYDEGVRAYTMDLPATDAKPYLKGNYEKAPFIGAVKAYYLYQPELYSVPGYEYELRKLPNPASFENVKAVLLEVFGYEQMPEEPYIYLEDFFFADQYVTNDFELFGLVAEYVGADNIITKRHPRDRYDRFTPCGYKTVGKSVVPWEIQLLANDLSKKVLISVSSTSILTPYIIFDSDMHVISLEKMFIGENPTHKDRAFSAFFEKLKAKINAEGVYFHTPRSLDELKEVMRYIKVAHYAKSDNAPSA